MGKKTVGKVLSVLKEAVRRFFVFLKKKPDSKRAYALSTYVSTFIGQFLDNFIFSQ